jgi:hypothetical protein
VGVDVIIPLSRSDDVFPHHPSKVSFLILLTPPMPEVIYPTDPKTWT